jgi:hypothetical protein
MNPSKFHRVDKKSNKKIFLTYVSNVASKFFKLKDFFFGQIWGLRNGTKS